MKHLKLITITFLTLFFCKNVYSQSKIYFDKDWEKTTKENAHFYRITNKKNDSLFHVKDFYINGVLQMDGYFSDLENETFEGKVSFYNKQGKITNSETYLKGELNGISTVYLENGNIDYTTEYKENRVYNGIEYGITQKRFYKNGEIIKDIEYNPPNDTYILKTKIYGKEIDTVFWRTAKGKELGFGTFKDYKIIDGLQVDNMLDCTVLAHYKNSLKEGSQKVYNPNGELIADMTFKKGLLILDKTLNPFTNKMVSCTYKNNEPFNGRWFEYKPMYKYYEEFIFENGKQIKHNYYTKDKNGKLTLYKSN